jgi:uncharacterized membrane protein
MEGIKDKKVSRKTTVQVIIKIISFLLFFCIYLVNPLEKTFNLPLIALVVTGLIVLFVLLLKSREKQYKHLPAIIGFSIGILIYLIF